MQQTFVARRLMCINQTTNLMKKILAVVLVLIVIGHVNAMEVEPNSPLGMSVIKNGALVKLFYRGEQSGKVKVTIYNEQGDIVFTETMQDMEQFMRPYNFKALAYGEYTIELSDESGIRFKKVPHYLVKESPRPAHVTHLRSGENRYMLAVPNTGKDALTVRIYAENSRLVFEEKQAIRGDFAKVYNLNAIEGDYTFEIVDRDGRSNRITKSTR